MKEEIDREKTYEDEWTIINHESFGGEGLEASGGISPGRVQSEMSGDKKATDFFYISLPI